MGTHKYHLNLFYSPLTSIQVEYPDIKDTVQDQ